MSSKCPMAQHVLQDIIDTMLEGGGTVAQAEGHDEALIVTRGCDESSLPFVTFPVVH